MLTTIALRCKKELWYLRRDAGTASNPKQISTLHFTKAVDDQAQDITARQLHSATFVWYRRL